MDLHDKDTFDLEKEIWHDTAVRKVYMTKTRYVVGGEYVIQYRHINRAAPHDMYVNG
jgi:hypothetical protein